MEYTMSVDQCGGLGNEIMVRKIFLQLKLNKLMNSRLDIDVNWGKHLMRNFTSERSEVKSSETHRDLRSSSPHIETVPQFCRYGGRGSGRNKLRPSRLEPTPNGPITVA